MKTTITPFIIALLLFTSCQETSELGDPGKHPTQTGVVDNCQVITSPCEVTDHPVFGITANMWLANFENHFNVEESADNHAYFKNELIHKLENLCSTCTQIRAYFVRIDQAKTPQLALVNVDTSTCSDQTQSDSILVSDSTGGAFHDVGTVEPWIAEWNSYVNDTLGDPFVQVLGYNYRWHLIWTVLKNKNNPDSLDLYAYYALRAVDNNLEFCLPDDIDDPHHHQGYIAIDLLMTNETDSLNDFKSHDFSMPCPQLCGDLVHPIDKYHH